MEGLPCRVVTLADQLCVSFSHIISEKATSFTDYMYQLFGRRGCHLPVLLDAKQEWLLPLLPPLCDR